MNIFNDIFFSEKLSELEERIEKLEEYIVEDAKTVRLKETFDEVMERHRKNSEPYIPGN